MKINHFYHIMLMGSLLFHTLSYSIPSETYTENNPLYTKQVKTALEQHHDQIIFQKRVKTEEAQTEAAQAQTEAAQAQEKTYNIVSRFIPKEDEHKTEFKEGQKKVAQGYERAAGVMNNLASIGEQASSYMERQLRDWNRNLTTQEKINKFKEYMFWGTLYTTIPITYYLLTKGAEITMDVIRAELLSPKPAILNKKQKPVYGRIDRLRRWWSGKKAQEMVFNTEVKNRLVEIKKKTYSLRDLIKQGKDRNYANLLLHGEPGTGKTLFAQVLAEQTNMDFIPVTAASLLQAGVEGIKHFDEIINMANRSKNGVIIFVDEADALFIDRSTLNPASEHYKVLNHILSIVDGRSNKFMMVAATNHAYLLDPAMGRRFQDRILMPLPDAETRAALAQLYINQILFNVKQTSKKFVAAAKKLFTPQHITDIVAKTAGLSHAEFADMIEAMRNKAELNKRMLTNQDIYSAIDEAIEKRKKSEEDKKIREQQAKKSQ